MAVKYENPRATYNIPLNSSENDIFRVGCAHLQNFLHINVKMDDCKPMMLKMHLELEDSPSSIGDAEERNIEHNNGLKQSVQQLEEEIKTLKDAFLQAEEDNVINRIDKAPDVDNNATQQESNCKKQAKNEHKLSAEHNDTESVASACAIKEHHTTRMPKEKPEVIDLRDNCVYIRDLQCTDSSLEKAFCNIRKLANEMNVEIPEDSVIHIEVQEKPKNYLDYYVYFCEADIKKEFLKNRRRYVYNPETRPLGILDYSDWGIVDIKNFQSSDLSLETAYVNVMGIALKMGITNEQEFRDCIDHIGVFKPPFKKNVLTYSIRFKREFDRKQFLHRKHILKQFPETESVIISDAGGYRLSFRNLNNVSMTVASANVIGLAKLMGLSLIADNFKRICILNHLSNYVDTRGHSLIVEFSGKRVKDKFLKKTDYLMQMNNLKYIEISDINVTENVVSIKYLLGHVVNAISFFGLAKQLGCSLTSDKIQYFFDLSKFIDKVCID